MKIRQLNNFSWRVKHNQKRNYILLQFGISLCWITNCETNRKRARFALSWTYCGPQWSCQRLHSPATEEDDPRRNSSKKGATNFAMFVTSVHIVLLRGNAPIVNRGITLQLHTLIDCLHVWHALWFCHLLWFFTSFLVTWDGKHPT